MNTRQKKKQYKKRYGHNPPKGADGAICFTSRMDWTWQQAGTIPEHLLRVQVEALTKIQALTPGGCGTHKKIIL